MVFGPDRFAFERLRGIDASSVAESWNNQASPTYSYSVGRRALTCAGCRCSLSLSTLGPRGRLPKNFKKSHTSKPKHKEKEATTLRPPHFLPHAPTKTHTHSLACSHCFSPPNTFTTHTVAPPPPRRHAKKSRDKIQHTMRSTTPRTSAPVGNVAAPLALLALGGGLYTLNPVVDPSQLESCLVSGGLVTLGRILRSVEKLVSKCALKPVNFNLLAPLHLAACTGGAAAARLGPSSASLAGVAPCSTRSPFHYYACDGGRFVSSSLSLFQARH